MQHDIWVHGQGTSTGWEYMTRLIAPRCVIRIDHRSFEAPEGRDSFVNGHDEEFVVEIWIDPRPESDKEVETILRSASDANEKFTRESEEEFGDGGDG